MSIVSKRVMGTPFFHELKKQASFFFKEKIKNARLALTDVTSAELLTEEATNGNPWAPDARTMSFISRAAFEIDDYWRIVEILHKRLSKFDRKLWREPYHSLIILEHLLTHGPESTAEEFQCDSKVIEDMGSFQYIDERGFNWGSMVRKKSERILKLLEKGPLLKEEREQARKISRGIRGFGSVNYRCSSDDNGSISTERGMDYFRKCNSHYERYEEQEHVTMEVQKNSTSMSNEMGERLMKASDIEEEEKASLVGVTALPTKSLAPEESNPLLLSNKESPKFELHNEEHPFNNVEHQCMETMLLSSKS